MEQNEVQLVQLPCKVCRLPVDIEAEKAKEYQKTNTLPLCLEHEIEAHPEAF